jgi:two-component system aerobic respiration control sensor histidine kinase ArcB
MEANNMKVLIVEDYEIAAKVLKKDLIKLGFSAVDYANNWESAIRYFILNEYDLVFMDIGIPDIDGMELSIIFRILEKRKKRSAIIIAATGYPIDKDFLEESQQNGINTVIQKPYYPIAVIETALSNMRISYIKEDKICSTYSDSRNKA